MLFTFKSSTNADLIMLEKSGKEILALLGKRPEDARGVITVEQLPGAIATLQKAITADIARSSRKATSSPSKSETDDELPVSFAQRGAPFVEMLERATKAGEPVVWGV